MTRTTFSIDEMLAEMEKLKRLEMEHKEQTLAEIITKYDFVVGSKECKCRLMEVLPEGANVICTPYMEDPTMIYAIKKFNIMDYIVEPQEGEDDYLLGEFYCDMISGWAEVTCLVDKTSY